LDDELIRTRYERGNDPTRVLALSDGVFAIILTLLVLEIHVPDLAQGQSLADAIREVRPSFVAFLISFVVVAIAWAGHRDLFAQIRRTDRALVWLNILYLLPLCILPFGASLLARFDRDPTALEMYGLLLLAVAATRLIIWVYATGRSHLLIGPIDQRSRRVGVMLVAVQAAAYALAIVVADGTPRLSLIIYAAMPVLYFVLITLVRDTGPSVAVDRGFT
jgi:uncharacterized membrane protein